VREARLRRHRRVRGKVKGTVERPRLVVHRSNRGITAQLVDDLSGKTVAAASWLALKQSFKGDKSEQATKVGKLLAASAKQAVSARMKKYWAARRAEESHRSRCRWPRASSPQS